MAMSARANRARKRRARRKLEAGRWRAKGRRRWWRQVRAELKAKLEERLARDATLEDIQPEPIPATTFASSNTWALPETKEDIIADLEALTERLRRRPRVAVRIRARTMEPFEQLLAGMPQDTYERRSTMARKFGPAAAGLLPIELDPVLRDDQVELDMSDGTVRRFHYVSKAQATG